MTSINNGNKLCIKYYLKVTFLLMLEIYNENYSENFSKIQVSLDGKCSTHIKVKKKQSLVSKADLNNILITYPKAL